MARAWRIEYEGACFLLLSHGNECRDIFLCDADRSLFLDTIGKCSERFEIELFSYFILPSSSRESINLMRSICLFRFGAFGIVMGLDAGPELDRGAKISGQSQGGIRTDTALLVADFADPHGRHVYVLGQPVLTAAHGF
jgi:hypothetical protein